MYTRFFCLTLTFTALFSGVGLALEYALAPAPVLIAQANTAPATVVQPLIQVLITGQVKQPGLYKIPRGAALSQLFTKAGGLSNQADSAQFNPDRIVQPGEVIHIPAKPSPRSKSSTKSAPSAVQLVSVNTADLKTLTSLPGIGPALAQRLIAHRQKQAFRQIKDLLKVKGIGAKKLAKMQGQIKL